MKTNHVLIISEAEIDLKKNIETVQLSLFSLISLKQLYYGVCLRHQVDTTATKVTDIKLVE